ncbi:MAG TPA: hypothetical protein VK067_06320 [Pseudogracilibacillus sp.]|nr:hypothetical protein [Pseudogracilibacillus sp.]
MRVVETSHDIGDGTKHAIRLFNQDKYDVVQVHMKKGETLTDHHAAEEVLIVVRTGEVVFTFGEERVNVTNKTILQMDPYEEHGVEALEESDFLIIKIK